MSEAAQAGDKVAGGAEAPQTAPPNTAPALFYHLTRSPREQVAMMLLGRALSQGWRVELRADPAHGPLAQLDERLWHGAAAEFLPPTITTFSPSMSFVLLLRAGGGGALGQDDVGYALRERLLPLATLLRHPMDKWCSLQFCVGCPTTNQYHSSPPFHIQSYSEFFPSSQSPLYMVNIVRNSHACKTSPR